MTRRLLRSRPPRQALAWAADRLGGPVVSARALRGGMSSAVHLPAVPVREGLREGVGRNGRRRDGVCDPAQPRMAAFVFTVTPPMSMLPTLIGLMGIHLPPSAAGPLMAAVRSGHVSPAMMHKLGAMLMGMHVPAATVSQMGALMSGKSPIPRSLA